MNRSGHINDRAQIATLQPLSRKVRVQHDDIEGVEAHRPSPGYAVHEPRHVTASRDKPDADD